MIKLDGWEAPPGAAAAAWNLEEVENPN